MKITSRVALLSFVLLAFGCKGHDSKTDDALNSDLSLAGQANSAAAADSVSAIERAHANAVAERREATSHEAAHSYRSSAAAVAAPAPAPTTTTVRNTKRDAAIGAGAGAILGAVTSKNKVKGGVVGGVAGGILGAVLGNNVDTKKVSHP